jgi:hypothetical protein
MARRTSLSGRALGLATLVLAGSLLPSPAPADGPVMSALVPDDTPKPAYSKLRFWAPAVARVNDHIHGPKINVYPPDRHPEIAPTVLMIRYRCPAVSPGATIIPVPTPPAESRFRY